MAFKLSIKLPPHLKKWVWATIAALVIGFIIGYFLSSGGGPGTQQRNVNIMKSGAQSQSNSQKLVDDKKNTYTVIIAALFLVGALVAYGYYKEKQKK